jgi:hypothetical protein
MLWSPVLTLLSKWKNLIVFYVSTRIQASRQYLLYTIEKELWVEPQQRYYVGSNV